MITRRPAAERGAFDHGWLRTAHTFSFADYHDPAHMGFRALRVINEDHIAPGRGFGTHPHRDMEILTWVLSGSLAHEDSMGNGAVIHPGEVQIMSAGTGILHSERNASTTEPVHLLQIWMLPARRGITPRYDQETVAPEAMRDRLLLLGAPPGSDATPIVTIHQDVRLLAGDLSPGAAVAHPLAAGRAAWVQVSKGSVQLGEHRLEQGDGAAVLEEPVLQLSADAEAQVLVFDLG